MMTGVPSWSSGLSCARLLSETRRHPELSDRPMEPGLFVPWIASWLRGH